MTAVVSVLTPTIPGRERFLEECKASVKAQTYVGTQHCVELDEAGEGCAVTMNSLAYRAIGDYLIPLADDDLLLPRAVETLLGYRDEADIIYAPPLVNGNEDRWWFYQAPPVIPSFALIPKRLWMDLGGYDEKLRREEDRDLWTRALNAGATFYRVDEPVWIYRQHANNKSFEVAA